MVVFEVWRQLPHDRSQFLAQIEQAGGKPIGERLLDLAQAPDMRDISWPLERKNEVGRRLRVPLSVAIGPLQGIERAIDLYNRQNFRRELQLSTLRQCAGVE